MYLLVLLLCVSFSSAANVTRRQVDVDFEVYYRTEISFPVDKMVFHDPTNEIFVVPVTDGHPDAPERAVLKVLDMDTGLLKRTLHLPAVSSANCAFSRNPVTGDLLIADSSDGGLFKIIDDPATAADGAYLRAIMLARDVGTVPNDMDFDQFGDIYVTDTVLGNIHKVPAHGYRGRSEIFVDVRGLKGADIDGIQPLSPMRPNTLTTNGIVWDDTRGHPECGRTVSEGGRCSVMYIGHYGRGSLLRVFMISDGRTNHLYRGSNPHHFHHLAHEAGDGETIQDPSVVEWLCCYNGLDGMVMDESKTYLIITQLGAATMLALHIDSATIVHEYGGFYGLQTFSGDVNFPECGGDETCYEPNGLLSASSVFYHNIGGTPFLIVPNLNLKYNEFPGLAATGYDNYMDAVTHHNILRFEFDPAVFNDISFLL